MLTMLVCSPTNVWLTSTKLPSSLLFLGVYQSQQAVMKGVAVVEDPSVLSKITVDLCQQAFLQKQTN